MQGTDAAGALRDSNAGGMRDVWVVAMSDAKETAYLVNQAGRQVLEADGGARKLLDTKLAYQAQNVVKFEVGAGMKPSDPTAGLSWTPTSFGAPLTSINQHERAL